jgi:hypothetical protein
VDVTAPVSIINPIAVKYLSELANSFIENAFNSLLASVKKDFDVERQTVVEEDYFHYLSVANFFMSYHTARRTVSHQLLF